MTSAEKPTKSDIIYEPDIVYAKDFDLAKIEAAIGETDILDCYHISSLLFTALKAAEKDESEDVKFLRLLYQMANIHETFDTPAEPYGPMAVMEGRRSMIPDDIKGSQTDELEKVASKISNDSLRARVADLVWVNDRKKYPMANLAITSYFSQIKRYFSGDAKFRYDLESLIDHRIFEITSRALTISRATKGNKDYPSDLLEQINAGFEKSLDHGDIPSMTRFLQLFLRFEINDNEKTIEKAFGEFKKRKSRDSNWDKNFLVEAERFYRRQKNTVLANECLMNIAECSVRRADEMSASSMASASWLMTAIEELKLARGPEAKKRYRELRQLLREKQEESVFDMQSFSHQIDLKDLIKRNIEYQKTLTLGHALGEFACLSVSKNPEELKKTAMEGIAQHPISSMFGSSQLDSEGKVVAKTEGSSFAHTDNDDAVLSAVANNMNYMRNVVVNSAIKPVRHLIQSEMNLSDEAISVICENSPFIPPFHKSIFLLGFRKFFIGEMVSAGSILLPQFENSLRYVLKTAGVDTSTIESDSTQVDRSISQLLNLFRKPLEELMGEATVFEIDYLFNSRKGPALRHEIAHGKYPAGHFYSDDVIYGCWFVFRIACLPLFPYWEEISNRIDAI